MTPSFSSVPPSLFGLQTSASSKRVAGGKRRPSDLRHEAGGVAHRRHLDAGLGAVDEGVEHLRIDRLAVGDVEILVEDVPDVVGIGLVIVRLVARALAGADHLEAGGARPVDVLADQRRLVAPGEAVDHAGRLGLAREQRAGHRVGLDVDHDDVLAVRDRLQRVMDAGARARRSPPRSPRCADRRSAPRRRR